MTKYICDTTKAEWFVYGATLGFCAACVYVGIKTSNLAKEPHYKNIPSDYWLTNSAVNLTDGTNVYNDSQLINRIANSYFRVGEQAVLIAKDKDDRERKALWEQHPDGVFTNRIDYLKVTTPPILAIDDVRIFDVVRFLNNGSTLGLETNDWSDGRTWTVLKQ